MDEATPTPPPTQATGSTGKQYAVVVKMLTDAYGKETKKSIRDRTNFELRATQDAERFPKDMRHGEISELMKERVAQEVIRQKKEKESGVWRIAHLFEGFDVDF